MRRKKSGLSTEAESPASAEAVKILVDGGTRHYDISAAAPLPQRNRG